MEVTINTTEPLKVKAEDVAAVRQALEDRGFYVRVVRVVPA